VLNSLADAVALLDRERNILLCNERLFERFGGGSGENGDSLYTIAAEARKACLESLEKLAAKESNPVPLEYGGRCYQVTSYPVSSPDGEPIRDRDGELFATLTAFRDITRDREIEKMRDEFIYMLTHDLKNPLGIILGSSTLILDGKLGALNEKQHRLLNNVVRSCQSMERIVQDFLTLSKIEAGRLDLRLDRVNLSDMIQGIIQLMQQQFREKDLKVSLKTDYDHVYVQADSLQLERVMVNLISNAVKYNREGGSITIRTGKVIEDGFVLTEVADKGIGIPAEDMPDIFEKFKRAGTGEVAKGTGLGLAIARNLIDSMGGRIWAESTEGKGSCFSFVLPQPAKNS
jgi:signal transduction histidine kinase